MNDVNSDKSFSRAFTIDDFQRICRMCLMDLNLDNLDNMTIDDVRDLLDYSVQMKIEIPDRLPQNVCVACIRELQRSCDFKRLIYNNDVILKKSLEEADELSLTDNKDDIVIDLHYLVDDDKSTLKETISPYFSDENTSGNNFSSENKNNHENVDLWRNLTVRLTKEDIYTCSHCGNGFIGRDRLVQHENAHENTEEIDDNVKTGESGKSEKITCNICGSNFQITTTFKTHIKQHAQEPAPVNECHVDAVSCEEPDHIFQSDVLLKDHQKIHETKSHVCSNCGKDFTTKKMLKEHSLTHTDKKPFSCTICESSFGFRSSLVRHLRIHSGEKPYKCEICLKAFIISSKLTVHKRSHTGEKPYKCNDCGKSFSTKGGLKVHLRTHTGEKPYSCSVCKMSFINFSGSARHSLIHSDEKPYKCKICQKTFKSSARLSDHTKIHTGEKPHECNVCGKKLSTKKGLNIHLRTHTGEKLYSCTVCDKSYSSSSSSRLHLRMHSGERPYECKTCSKTFKCVDELTKHSKIHTGVHVQ